MSDVPVAPGSFDVRLSVVLGQKAKFLMPGMACKVKLVPYRKKDAITVPVKSVFADELDDEKHYVWVLDKGGKPQRRDVDDRREERQADGNPQRTERGREGVVGSTKE